MEKGLVVAVYTDSEDDKFNVGKIIAKNDEFLLLNSITPEGKNDGLLLYRLEDIDKVEIQSKYLLNLEKIMESTAEIDLQIENDYFDSVLQYAMKNKKLVDLQIDYSTYCDVSGYVDCFNRNYCKICQIDNNGENDGIAYIPYNKITGIACDTYKHKLIEKIKSK